MKKICALTMTVVLMLSLCIPAFAADTPKTVTLLTEVAKTKKLYAHVTGHTYADKSNPLNFDIYDDFSTDKICCSLNRFGVQAIYDGTSGTVQCVFKYLLCYLSASPKKVPLMGTAVIAVEAFQDVFREFLKDPTLSGFTHDISTVERSGKTCTKETFTGKLLKVSGSFYYDTDGKLCEIQLTDTLGASIGFNVENVAVDYNNDVFAVPDYFFDLSAIWAILSSLLSIFTPA